MFEFDWDEGSNGTVSGMTRDDALVDQAWATDNDVEVGDTLAVTTPTGREAKYTVHGKLNDTADLWGDFVLTHEALEQDFRVRQEGMILVNYEAGADPDAVRREIEAVVDRAFPIVEVLDQEQLKDRFAEQVGQLVNLLYALLSLAVIVSLFGLVNTLTLSIYERTRELGLLRAIGMSRRQVRRVVRYEAVITALLGALMGSVLGMFFAVIVSRPLADEGFNLSWPIGTLIILFILAAIAGVVAAILPAGARRGSTCWKRSHTSSLRTMQLLGRDYLKIYLEDHYAGATAGLELARRTADANRGTPYGDVLEPIAREIEEDRDTLRAIMTTLGVGPDRFKVAAAWAGEKAGRLKLNGHLTSYSPQSRVIEIEGLVVGVTGKRCLWAALRRRSSRRSRGSAWSSSSACSRAPSASSSELEELRLKAVSEAVAAADARLSRWR